MIRPLPNTKFGGAWTRVPWLADVTGARLMSCVVDHTSSDAVRRTPRALAEISQVAEFRLGSFARQGGGENFTLSTHDVWLYPGMALAIMLS